MPSEAYENLVDLLSGTRITPELPVDEARSRWDRMEDVLPLAPGIAIETVDAGGVPGLWFVPEGETRHTIVHLHGGGYVIGSTRSHRAFASHLAAATSARLLLLDYRRAPEHPAPAGLDDTLAAYFWLLDGGTSSDELVLSGDSAGGGLALSAMVRLRDRGLPTPAAGLLLSPWLDLTLSGESMAIRAHEDIILSPEILELWGSLYRGALPADDPVVSPLLADLDRLPPLLVQVGTREVLLDDARRLPKRVGPSGHVELRVHEDMIHIWPVLAAGVVPEAAQAIDEVAEFLRDPGSRAGGRASPVSP